ncbi:MAG: preprotein translocase subunit SecE [Caenibius sp.]
MASGVSARGESRRNHGKTNPGEFLRQVRAEVSKIVWPTRRETVTTAIFVAILMTLLATLFFLGIDSIFSAVIALAAHRSPEPS